MKKKAITIVVLVALLFLFCMNIFVQQKFIKAYTYTEIENRGYATKDISSIKIDHSYFRRILGYNEWRISVEFEKEPNVFFWFTYKDNKIVFQGVSSEPMLDKEAIIEYSEKFKEGNLFK